MSTGLQSPETRRRRAKRGRALAGAASLAAHLAIFMVMLHVRPEPPRPPEPEPITVSLIDQPQSIVVAPSTPGDPAPAATPPPIPTRSIMRPTRLPPQVTPQPADPEPQEPTPVLSDGQIAGAATAGSGNGGGGGGGGCNILRALQAALRKDPLVQTEVTNAHRQSGRALFVWNGDWIKSSGQEGKGLAALRQAIIWEVAFSPEACRAEPVHGLIKISLNDAPGGPQVVVGQDEWRWSDLVHLRR